ncbi:MAG: YihA family ribosome biogenesis GTP-binding protein [Oscillospiraceae bacterium]|nr:YihA family ribosome biogenesis GTP-binding protein [Oscillospiraceae bacterium]
MDNGENTVNWNIAEFSAAYGLASQLPGGKCPEIAFAGRSNVGKSTLINKLFNRKNLARVSAVPGKTATINFYRCDTVTFVDLPGYGYAKTAKTELHRWRDLINGYLQAQRDLRAVLLLIDMRHPPTKDDLQMVDFLMDTEMPFAIVLTKADKLNRTQRNQRLAALPNEIPQFEEMNVTVFSSMTGEGVPELRKLIEEITVEMPDEE